MTGLVVLVLRLLAAAALYAFLGLALWIMWRDLRRTSTSAAGGGVPSIRLEARLRSQSPAVRLFVQPEVIFGRDPLCDVPLNDKAVSGRHARLSFHHGQWWLDDLGSTNGTRLNREKVQASTVLTNGDEIRCGSARILVALPGEAARSESWQGGQDD